MPPKTKKKCKPGRKHHAVKKIIIVCCQQERNLFHRQTERKNSNPKFPKSVLADVFQKKSKQSRKTMQTNLRRLPGTRATLIFGTSRHRFVFRCGPAWHLSKVGLVPHGGKWHNENCELNETRLYTRRRRRRMKHQVSCLFLKSDCNSRGSCQITNVCSREKNI